MFYSSGRAAIFEGPSPRWDEYPFFVGNEDLKKVKSFLQKFSLESFAITNQSAKLFHLKRFALYGIFVSDLQMFLYDLGLRNDNKMDEYIHHGTVVNTYIRHAW